MAQYDETKYYVYAYLRSDGAPYYIGKGCGDRAYARHNGVGVPSDKSKIVFLEKGRTNFGALWLERIYIREFGRIDNGTGILRNKTDGGEDPPILKGGDHPNFGKPLPWLVGDKHPNYGRPIKWFEGDKNPSKRPDVRKKISESKIGDLNPMKRPEVKRKHLESVRKKEYVDFFSGGNNPRALKIVCINTDMVFDCIKDAAEWCGGCAKTIGRVCNGKSKRSGRHPETNELLSWRHL
jgi:hypothetical protein